MSENLLTRIINLLNRAKPDGLNFDALTYHIYNGEQDFFDKTPEMRHVATKVKNILETYHAYIVCDERGAFHLKKGIPHQLCFNFEEQNEQTTPNILISEETNEEYTNQQLLFDFFDEEANTSSDYSMHSEPRPFPTLFDDDPDFI